MKMQFKLTINQMKKENMVSEVISLKDRNLPLLIYKLVPESVKMAVLPQLKKMKGLEKWLSG